MNLNIHHYIIGFHPIYLTYFHQWRAFQTEEKPQFFISSKLYSSIAPQGHFVKYISPNELTHKDQSDTYMYGLIDDSIIYGIKTSDFFHYEIMILESTLNKDAIEYSLSLRIFSHIVSFDNNLILHASAIKYHQHSILFSGSTKVGKTTLAKRMINHHPKIEFINDDKPLVSFEEGMFYVHGTPWAGEEGLCQSISSKLSCIICLEQGSHSEVKTMTNHEKVVHLMEHSYHLFDEKFMDIHLNLLNHLIDQVPIYKMIVTNDDQAYDVFHEWFIRNISKL